MADFKVATDLTITGPYIRQLGEVATLFARLEKQGAAFNRLLGGMTLGKGITDSIGKVGKELSSLQGIGAATVAGLNKHLSGITLGAKPHQSITALRDHLGTLKGTSATVGTAIKGNLAGAFTGLRGAASGVKTDIAGWSTEIAAAERRMAQLTSRMRSAGGTSIRRGGGGGSILDTIATGPTHSGILAGQNVERLGGGILHRSGELQRQTNIFKMAGNSESDAALGLQAAYKSARLVPDINVTEQFKLFRELSAATQDNAGSAELLPEVAKARSVISAATGRENDEDMRRLFKFIELRGHAIDPKQHKIIPKMFIEELDAATKALVVGQGLLTTNDLQQFVRQAGPMAKGMSSEELYTSALAAMEDMGGARTGTSLSAVGRQFIGGTMTSKVAGVLNEFGMLTGKGQDVSDAGKITITDPSKAIKGYDTLTKGTFKDFIDKEVRPALEAKGIMSRADQNKQVYRMFGTDTARRLGSLYLSSPEQVEALGHRYKQAMGIGAYDKVLGGGKDFETATKGIHEAFTTLKTALGDAQGIAPLANSLAHALAGLAEVVKDKPEVGTTATLGVVGAGAAAIGYGTLKTLTGFGLPAAATQLSGAAVALEAAAIKLGGGSAVKDVAQAAPLAGFGLPGIVAGTVAAGAFGIYAQSKMMPDQLKQRGAGGFDPATGTGVDTNPMSGMAPDRPWLMDWWKRHAPTILGGDALKEEAAKVGKAAGVATATGFGGEDFSGAGSKAGASIIAGFLSALAKLGGSGEGATPISFGGGGMGGLIHKASLGGSNDNHGGSVTRALAVGSGSGIGHTASKAERAAYIRASAIRNGIDPNIALRVAQSEGFNTYVGDQGRSFGDWQLFTGGGLGNLALKRGINIRDPNTWRQQTDFAMEQARKGGWGPWYGAGRVGIGKQQGIGVKALQPPTTAGPASRQQMVQVTHQTVLDGKVIAKTVTRHMASAAKYPHSAGGMDTHGAWSPPSHQSADAA